MTVIIRIAQIVLIGAASNAVFIGAAYRLAGLPQGLLYAIAAGVLLLVNLFPGRVKNTSRRLRALWKGHSLLELFSGSFLVDLSANVWLGLRLSSMGLPWWVLVVNCSVCLLSAVVLLLNGLSHVFFTSLQLGIRWRVLVLLLWWVPGVNIWLLYKVSRLVRREYDIETAKNELNETRRESEICRTRYPLLLIHGVFFRDLRYFNYWGRIPKELKKNGAEIYLGEQQSALSVEETGAELAEKIEQIVRETGCEKLNIIAHSKGGLDARYAVSCLGMDKYVASLTTVNTPHRGCVFADKLLEKAPEKLVVSVAKKYNTALTKLGDKSPDFIAAVEDLTAARCTRFNETVHDSPQVLYQSVVSKMNSWTAGTFPMNISHFLISPHDGENDGLVSVDSAQWGSACLMVHPPGRRGISHGDMIDLNRENIDGFDVRELYVDIVRGLKAQAL